MNANYNNFICWQIFCEQCSCATRRRGGRGKNTGDGWEPGTSNEADRLE